MSYLNPLRLHFSGQFQANVSTVNNDAGHYDNSRFVPSFQELQGPNFNPPNGWFNPQGDASFRLLGCKVTAAVQNNVSVACGDPILSYLVCDTDYRVPGKLVDLDSEQQLVSEIWGLEVRITDSDGNTLMKGDYKPAAFIDIWDRTPSGQGGDANACAMYQSVLENLEWGDVSASQFLTKLKASASDGLLSIKFNVDGMNLNYTSPDFMCGRIVGSIGPAETSEPSFLTPGRQFMASSAPGGNFFKPAGGINFFAGKVDFGSNCIFLDLGNALSTSTTGGPVNDLGDLTLGYYKEGSDPLKTAGSFTKLATIPAEGDDGYAGAEWYNKTAGVVAVPLSAGQLTAIAKAPLALYVDAGEGKVPATYILEAPDGKFVRADQYVYRLSPGDKVSIPVYVTQYGVVLANEEVEFVSDPSQLQPGSLIFPHDDIPVQTPLAALGSLNSNTTNENGLTHLNLWLSDPGTPRYFNGHYGIDGQVYGVRPTLKDPQGAQNPWNFISILLWTEFTAADPLTWQEVAPIFQQYANLYPVMNRFLNMGDYHSVVQNAGLLKLAFGLDEANPNSMPVTRDLSPAKRQTILKWLDNPVQGAKKSAFAAKFDDDAKPDTSTVAQTQSKPDWANSGKAAAAARRLVNKSAAN